MSRHCCSSGRIDETDTLLSRPYDGDRPDHRPGFGCPECNSRALGCRDPLAGPIVLGFGILGAIYRRREERVYWVGFLIFGVGYLMLAFGPWGFDSTLISTEVLHNLGERTHMRDMSIAYAPSQYDSFTGTRNRREIEVLDGLRKAWTGLRP